MGWIKYLFGDRIDNANAAGVRIYKKFLAVIGDGNAVGVLDVIMSEEDFKITIRSSLNKTPDAHTYLSNKYAPPTQSPSH